MIQGHGRDYKMQHSVRKWMSRIPLGVRRRFSGLIRIESGWENLKEKENRRGETLSHRAQERHPELGPLLGEERAGAAAVGGVD